jgi:hypothetical protein
MLISPPQTRRGSKYYYSAIFIKSGGGADLSQLLEFNTTPIKKL